MTVPNEAERHLSETLDNILESVYIVRHNALRFALVAEWYTQQVEGLCREAWWFESTRGHLIDMVLATIEGRLPYL